MRQIKFAYIILWLSLAWLCPAQSQPPQEPPPALGEFPYYEPNLEAKQAASLAARGKLAEAVAAYIAIADVNPRTILGVESLFSAAQLVDTVEESNNLLQRIIEEYQNSRFEIFAEFTLVGRNLSPSLSFQEKMVALDGFVQQVGGPSVDSILNATDHRPLLAQFSALPIETQLGLGGVYHDFFDGLHRPERIDDAIRLAQFNQNAFAHAEWTLMHSFRNDLLWALLTKKGAQGVHTIPPQDPVVIPVYPAPNSVVGSAFTLKFKVEGGDFRQANLDANPIVRLDGQEVTLGTVHLENNLNLEENVPYETLHVIVDFENLSPGLHEISVTAQIQGYDNSGLGRIDHTWAFTVSGAPPGPTTETLTTTKDAIIDNFDPNGNEGANGILALDKLLGRSSRSLVAFDLSDVDTAQLTKATLVLSIHKEEKILGCGGGENVSVQALTNPWVEGNGKTYKVFPLTQRRRGSGSGATWNRDTDTNIANLVPNGGTAWKGAQSATMPRTAPLVMARDHMEGTLSFDVTDDVINGALHGWLVRKQHENLASRISFYSKEGATSKGDPNLAPRLILEYGEPTAQAELEKVAQAVASFLGLPTRRLMALQPEVTPLEGGKRWKEVLQESPRAAFLVEQVVTGLAGQHPLPRLGAQLAYRTWLRGELSLA